MSRILGKDYFETHTEQERRFLEDKGEKHVIVDKEEYEAVLHFLISHMVSVEDIKKHYELGILRGVRIDKSKWREFVDGEMSQIDETYFKDQLEKFNKAEEAMRISIFGDRQERLTKDGKPFTASGCIPPFEEWMQKKKEDRSNNSKKVDD